ncbi:DUF1232 domain-containing protein [soil metagenome]
MGTGLALTWLALIVFLFTAKPQGAKLKESLRLLPDILRLLRRLATDTSLSASIRLRLWLLLGYLAVPIDIVPDFLPVVGYADDAIIVAAVLRSIVRKAGPQVVASHWPGTKDGLEALWRVAGLDGSPHE